MAVSISKPAINLREQLAKLAGLKISPELVRMDFSNLVANGGFDSDTVWIKSGTTISSGTLNFSSVSSGLQTYQFFSEVGHFYAGFSISDYVEGTAQLLIHGDGTIVAALAENGNVAAAFSTTSAAARFAIRSLNTTTLKVDNVFRWEADPSDNAPWLRLPYGYTVSRLGMIVRDGVVLHPDDYTEISDGKQTWIKPLVAPGAATQFSIWGYTE